MTSTKKSAAPGQGNDAQQLGSSRAISGAEATAPTNTSAKGQAAWFFHYMRALESCELEPATCWLLMYLARRAEPGTGQLRDSNAYALTSLAKSVRISRRALQRHLDLAEAAGFLHRDIPTREAARLRHERTKYRLLMPAAAARPIDQLDLSSTPEQAADDQAAEQVVDNSPTTPDGYTDQAAELVQDLPQAEAESAPELVQDLPQAEAESAHKAFPSSSLEIPSSPRCSAADATEDEGEIDRKNDNTDQQPSGRPSAAAAAEQLVTARTGSSEAESRRVVENITASGKVHSSLLGYVRRLAENGDLAELLDQARIDLAAEYLEQQRPAVDQAIRERSHDCEHGTPAGLMPLASTNQPRCPLCRRAAARHLQAVPA